MKHLLSAVWALVLLACASGNVCEQAADVRAAAADDECASAFQSGCTFCACARQGLIFDSATDSCRDPEPSPCAGEVEATARSCVEDRALCESTTRALVGAAIEVLCE